MKNTLLLLAKALLWFLLVMLLRPINYLLDTSLAAYVRVKEKCEDMQELGSKSAQLSKVFAILFVIIVIFILTLYFYGKFV